MMRWPESAPKVEIKYDENSEGQTEGCATCAGLTPVRATVLYPAPFAALRQRFCDGGDASFVESLWHSEPWDSGRGGKSGSTFRKTLDGRYLLKQVSPFPASSQPSPNPLPRLSSSQVPKSEFWSFHEHARAYFAFVSNTPTTLPSVLVKVCRNVCLCVPPLGRLFDRVSFPFFQGPRSVDGRISGNRHREACNSLFTCPGRFLTTRCLKIKMP